MSLCVCETEKESAYKAMLSSGIALLKEHEEVLKEVQTQSVASTSARQRLEDLSTQCAGTLTCLEGVYYRTFPCLLISLCVTGCSEQGCLISCFVECAGRCMLRN